MKKTAKSVLLMLVMAVMLVALTACGGNKLTATKEYSEDESFFGAYKETVEIKFKDDKVDKVTMTMEFEDKEKAEAIASVYKLAGEELEGVETKTSGKKFIMTMDGDTYAKQEGIDKDKLSKDDIKAELEEAGYTVK